MSKKKSKTNRRKSVKSVVKKKKKSPREIKTKRSISRGKRKRKSPPISAVKVKSLGYDCENLTEADKAAGLDVSLAELFDKYPKLKEAWDRGQFLQKIYKYADSVETVSQASRKLGLPSGEAFRELLDTDIEIANIWNNKRDDTVIAARRGIIAAAEAGNPTAVKYIEGFLKEDNKTAAVSTDTKRLTQIAVAELFGVERQTIRNWEDKYNCPRNTDKTYDLARVIAWYKDYAGSQASPKNDSKDKLRDWKAEKERLNVLERQKQLIPKEQVIIDYQGRWQNINKKIIYKLRDIAASCHGESADEIEKILLSYFDTLKQEWKDVPEYLDLSDKAKKIFTDLLAIIERENAVA